MAKASDNLFPSVLFVEGSAPANPASGDQRIFLDTADHKLKRVNSTGTVTTIEGGGGSGALTQIADTIVGAGGVASVTFSSIAGTYNHLLLLCRDRSDTAATFAWRYIRFNGDAGTNYNSTLYQAQGGNGFFTTDELGLAQGYAGMMTAASSTSANDAGAGRIDINDYARTSWNKAYIADSVTRMDSSGTDLRNERAWGQWQNTAAITSITILASAGNLAQNSRYTLYGLT